MSFKPILIAAGIGMVSFIMISCSGQHEDPRISFCRSLAVHLTQSSTDVVWQDRGQEIVRPEYAIIKLAAGEQHAECYYEYEAVEESALDHVDELDAYATLPYKMILNGAEVDKNQLAEAMKAEQIAAAKQTLGKVQAGFDSLLNKIKQLF